MGVLAQASLFTIAWLLPAHAQTAADVVAEIAEIETDGADAIELPGVVVTAASPVVKRKPARRRVAAPESSTPASATPASAASATTASASPSNTPTASASDSDGGFTPPPGTLVIADDAFVPVTVVTDREILATPGGTITHSLANKPGITASNFTAGASRPVIRGLDTYRVRTQENGIGTHDVAALSEDHAVPLDPFSADRIEVVRGPATLRYGSQAIGGVVAVENDRIPTSIPLNGWRGEIQGGYSSVDNGHDGALSVTAGASGVAVHGDAFRRQTGDYNSPIGKIENSFVESNGASFGGSLIGLDGYAGAAFVVLDSSYGIAGEDARIDLDQYKFLSRGEARVRDYGIEAIRYWFGVSDYEHQEVEVEADGDEEVGSRFTNNEQEFRAEVQHQTTATTLGALDGAIGIQAGHSDRRARSFEGDSLLEPARTISVAAFLFEELQVSRKLTLQGAARIEYTEVDGRTRDITITDPGGLAPPVITAAPVDGTRSFVPVSLSAGALYAFPLGVVARLTGQYVERAPADAELFSNGVHEATQTFEIGNPDLDKEQVFSTELGFAKAAGAFRFDISGYYSRYDGFIFKELQGIGCGETLADCGVEDELDLVIFQQREATFYGIDLFAAVDLFRLSSGMVSLEGQYDFVRARLDRGENVPRIQPHRLGGGLAYRSADWFGRIGLLHAFDQDRIGVNETPTDDYTLLNAELSYTWRSLDVGHGATETTIGVRGDNLLDQEVRNHVSFRKDEIVEPGASVRVFGKVRFN